MSNQVGILQKEIEKLAQELKELKTTMTSENQEIETLQMQLLTGNQTLQSKLLEKDSEITKLTEIKKNQSITIQQLSSKVQNNSTLSDSEKSRLNDEIQRLTTIN